MGTRDAEVVRPPGAGERILRGDARMRLLPFLGPAFIACVAYMDPGNFATNIAGGSKFGFTLVWVIVASNLMAMLIQTLSAKLGIATGRNLPEVCRERFSRRTSIGLWIQAEVIAMATDLAEFLGAALGIKLLLHIPLFPAAVITGVITFLILCGTLSLSVLDARMESKTAQMATSLQVANAELQHLVLHDTLTKLPNRILLEDRLQHIKTPLSLSVLGCVVNGPGEARETDIGITGGGQGKHMVYLSGVTDHHVQDAEMIDHIVKLVEAKAAEIEAASHAVAHAAE